MGARDREESPIPHHNLGGDEEMSYGETGPGEMTSQKLLTILPRSPALGGSQAFCQGSDELWFKPLPAWSAWKPAGSAECMAKPFPYMDSPSEPPDQGSGRTPP